MLARLGLTALLAGLTAFPAWSQGAPAARLDVAPTEATVGDRLRAVLTVELPATSELEPPRLGPELGPFTVESGSWQGPERIEGTRRWTWNGELAAYEPGVHRVPAIEVGWSVSGEPGVLSTETFEITIRSVLEHASDTAEPGLADLKPPASIPPRYGPLWAALAIVGSLLAAAAVLWWLHRRYGSLLGAVEMQDDPFRRTPPHVWVYAELQGLLEQRLPEQGEIDRFYGEVATILKRYLSGRFRVDLLEHTTAEVPALLEQAGAHPEALESTRQALECCDSVKFARERPGPDEWRAIVQRVYAIVDATKPAESAEAGAQAGAA